MLMIPNGLKFNFNNTAYRFWCKKPIHLNFYRPIGIYSGVGNEEEVQSLTDRPTSGDYFDLQVVEEMKRLVNALKSANVPDFFAYSFTGVLTDLVGAETMKRDDGDSIDNKTENTSQSSGFIKTGATNFVLRKIRFKHTSQDNPNPFYVVMSASGYEPRF